MNKNKYLLNVGYYDRCWAIAGEQWSLGADAFGNLSLHLSISHPPITKVTLDSLPGAAPAFLCPRAFSYR